jgi:hypothetical protein
MRSQCNISGRLALILALAFAGTASLSAAEWSVKMAEKAPPQSLDASIREVLEPKAFQLFKGGQPVYEFWFRKEIPLKAKPESVSAGLKALAETTLVGAAVIHKNLRDYRDDELVQGAYTVRFALQPQDGDHLGTADYPYFLVLVPVPLDKTIDYLSTYRKLVKTSGKNTSTGHPAILSLRPVSSEEGAYPRLTEPAPDHRALRLKLPAKPGGESAPVSLVFDLVFEGTAVH